MKMSWDDFRYLGYILFGVGIATLAKSGGMACAGYEISPTQTGIFGAVCLIFGSSWLSRTDKK
jgi:hypothetical protein